MDKKSKIFLGLLILIAVFSLLVMFYKTVILEDFQTINTVEEEKVDL